MTQVINDNDLERFLGPLPAEWNRLAPADLGGFHDEVIDDGRAGWLAGAVRVTLLSNRAPPDG